jgi:ankyrin repeat protein
LTPNNDPIIGCLLLHAACHNERVNEGIIRYILEYFPDASSAADDIGYTPLHYACSNKNITLNIIQLLIDAAPTSVRTVDNKGHMPLRYICGNKNVDEISATDILKLLIEKCPEAVRHADDNGLLPIHAACMSMSLECCRVLIEAYPGSERMGNSIGVLPLHCACFYGTVAVVEYLYKLYPDAINHATPGGGYPIHIAIILGTKYRDNPAAAVDVVKFLLDCDPNVKLQKYRGIFSLLHVACVEDYNESNIEAGIQIIKLIYDAHPEAIEDDNEITFITHHQIQTFINSELVYSRLASDHRLMMTPDKKGQLPLHTALHDNVRLGSIKLLVKGNPSAIRTFNNSGAIPLHVACQHHESTSVVQYLIERDATTLRAVDFDHNTVLHYACRGVKYDTVALLLDKFDAVSVSKRNAHKKLPIDILLESDEVLDRESTEYTECVFRLLRAYPETTMNLHTNT